MDDESTMTIMLQRSWASSEAECVGIFIEIYVNVKHPV